MPLALKSRARTNFIKRCLYILVSSSTWYMLVLLYNIVDETFLLCFGHSMIFIYFS